MSSHGPRTGEEKSTVSVEIETGTWNYFLMKIKQKKLFPQKKLISDLEWRMEARWIFRIISDLYKGIQALGRHRERQVVDSVDQQLDQASPETNILWNFPFSWPDKSFLWPLLPHFFFFLLKTKQTKKHVWVWVSVMCNQKISNQYIPTHHCSYTIAGSFLFFFYFLWKSSFLFFQSLSDIHTAHF